MKIKKKIILFIVSVLFIFSIGLNTKASEVPNWEFLPNGINYLSNDYFSYTESSNINQGILEPLNMIRVKNNTKYYIYFYCYQDGKFNGASISYYDQEKNYLGIIDYNITDNTVITFNTPSDCKYIELELSVEEEWGISLNLFNVEENYIMSDHQLVLSSLTLNDIEYKGPIIDYSPVISGNDGYYITNVDDPITLEEIMAGIRAYDDTDGDITNRITIVENTFSANRNKVGNWKIKLSVSDSSGNTTLFTINVSVIDNTIPVINGDTSFSIKSTDNFSVDYFYPKIKVVDNVDGDISNNIRIVTDNYTPNKNNPGTYRVSCYVVDSSNNRLDFEFSVTVVYDDTVSPVFGGQFVYDVNKTTSVSIQTILSNITVVDNVDGNIINKVTVKEDFYSHAPNRVGTWRIVLEVSDKAGNIATQEITINVLDNISPIFYIDTHTINIDLRSNNLQISDLVGFLYDTDAIKKDVSYQVVYDEYSENKNKVGEYRVVLEVEGKPLTLSVNVMEKKEQKKTFIKKVLDFFINIFQRISSFFKRIF